MRNTKCPNSYPLSFNTAHINNPFFIQGSQPIMIKRKDIQAKWGNPYNVYCLSIVEFLLVWLSIKDNSMLCSVYSNLLDIIICTLHIIDFFLLVKKTLSQVFGRTKLHKRGSRNIFFSHLFNKVIAIKKQFSSTTLVQSNIWHNKCLLLTQY